jgi:hypothetical protein
METTKMRRESRIQPNDPEHMPTVECHAILYYTHAINTAYEGGETTYSPLQKLMVYLDRDAWEADVMALAMKGEKFSAFKIVPASINVKVTVS